MRRRIVGSSCAAVVLAFAVAAVGQTSTQTPTQSPVQGGNAQTPPSAQRSTTSPRTSTSQEVTLVGCVMRGGSTSSTSTQSASAAGSEFILSNATLSADVAHPSATAGSSTTSTTPGSSTSTASTSRTGSSTTGISGQATGRSYALNGATSDLSKYVNQRVEIVGHVEGGAVGTTGTATAEGAAGATAGTTADRHEGAQAKAGDTGQASATAREGGASASATVGTTGATKMPTVTVTSVRPTQGSCL